MVNNLKFITVLIAVVFPVVALAAEVEQFSCDGKKQLTAQQSSDLMKKVQQSYSKTTSLAGDFSQESFLAALEVSERSTGKMWFATPGKMRWEYETPKPQTVVIADSTMWLYQKGANQVMIDKLNEVLLSDLPISFMMGIGDLERDFELKGACLGTGSSAVLQLVPKSNNSKDLNAESSKSSDTTQLQGFELLVNSQSGAPLGAKVTSLGGNVTAILFRGLAPVAEDAAKFVLDHPSGVDIIDRRPKSE